MNESLRHQTPFTFADHSQLEYDNGRKLSSFGYPQMNHGWIQCISKRYGQMYYFNVETCCSTWDRPSSQFMPTRIERPLNSMSDEDLEDVPSILVSDIENGDEDDDDEEYEEEINADLPPDADDVPRPTISVKETKDSREKKFRAEVLFKLFHYSRDRNDKACEAVAPLDCEITQDDSNDNFETILAEVCYSSESDCKPSRHSGSEDEESFDGLSREDQDRFGELNGLDALRTNSPKIKIEANPSDVSVSSAEETDIGSRQLGLSSDDEETKEEAENEKYTAHEWRSSLPRLKSIQFADLTRPRKKKKRKTTKKRKVDEKNEISREPATNKVITTIREVNGVTTVNYDYLEPELPSGVKMRNLSDSGSSACYGNWYSDANKKDDDKGANEKSDKIPKTFGFPYNPADLSESDSSDSSSSSASSSSASSSSTEESVAVKRVRVEKILEVTKNEERKENKSRKSSSSSARSDSSWKNSGSSGYDDDD